MDFTLSEEQQELAGLVRRIATDQLSQQRLKQVEAEVRKYIDESVPLVRDRAIKIAPTTIGPILE